MAWVEAHHLRYECVNQNAGGLSESAVVDGMLLIVQTTEVVVVNTQGTPSYSSIKHTDIALYSKCPRFAYSSVGHDVNIAETQLVTAVCCHVWTAAVTASSCNLR